MYWYHNMNLSDSDIELLARTETIELMMKNRITVDFGELNSPSFDDLGLENTVDLYYIKVLGDSVMQFWFKDSRDVLELEQAGADIVAVDATERLRPDGITFARFMEQVRAKTNIAILADVDSLKSALLAQSLGCDAVATTLSGYTETPAPELPNLKLVSEIANKVQIPIIAEGGYHRSEQIVQAIEAGAWCVCLGTAITNPYLLTKHFLSGIIDN